MFILVSVSVLERSTVVQRDILSTKDLSLSLSLSLSHLRFLYYSDFLPWYTRERYTHTHTHTRCSIVN